MPNYVPHKPEYGEDYLKSWVFPLEKIREGQKAGLANWPLT